MRYLIIILTFFFFVSVHGKKNKTLPCSEYVRKLIFAEKEFTGCAVENSVPVSFCDSCKDHYDLLTDHYNNFVNANDTKTNISCKSIYFDRDRMNIVETVYDQLTGLWNKGFCSECWTDRNETEDMLNNITDFKSCILQKKQPCISCKQFYLQINSMYESIESRHKGKICFDIQDMMNKSRITWSRDLKCCKRESNLVAYSAVSVSLAYLVILFYCSMIIITKRAERNHGTIDNANGEDSTTNNTTRNVASTETNTSSNRSPPASNLRLPSTSAEPASSSLHSSSANKLTQYCAGCYNEYKEVDILYKEFMEGTDSLSTKKCKEEYKDDLKIINYIYNYSQLLWKELTCDECQVHFNETNSFVKDCENFHNCVEQNRNESCTKCNDFYQKIIGVYKGIREESPGRICGEILENMRHVETVWAKSHCNKKQKSSLTVFLAVSSALMILPGIFYGGLARQSYNQCSENANDDQARSETAEGGSGNGEALPSVEPSASSSSSNKKDGKEYEKKVDDSSDASTDNEEVILDLNHTKHELLKLSQQLEVPPQAELIPVDSLKSDNSSDEEPVLSSPLAANSQLILLDI